MRKILLVALLAGAVMPAIAQMPGRDLTAVFEEADTDHDGRISRAEFLVARSANFDRMDRNGDGVVARDDFAHLLQLRPQAGRRINAMIAEADGNHDNKITRAEFATAPTMLFDRADANHDGYVDKAELAALRVGLQQLKQER